MIERSKNYLKGEYLQVYTALTNYAFVKNIDSYHLEEMLTELIDSLLEAQRNNEPVSKIIGDDIEKFCEDFVSDTKRTSRIVSVIAKWLSITALWNLVYYLLNIFDIQKDKSNTLSISAIPSLVFVFLGITLDILIPVLFKNKIFSMKTRLSNFSAYVIIPVIIPVTALMNYKDTLPLQINLKLLLLICIIVVIVILIGGIIFYRNIRLLNKKKEKLSKEDDESLNMFNLSYLWVKSFEEKNEKLKKKNKKELTKEEFNNTTINNYKKKIDVLLLIIFAVTLVIVTVFVAIMCSLNYEFIYEGLICAVVIFTLCSFCYIPMFVIIVNNGKTARKLIEKLEKENLSIFDYYEKEINGK